MRYYVMDRLEELKYYIDSICVYNVENDDVIMSLRELLYGIDGENVPKLYSKFFRKLTACKSLCDHISDFVLTDDNVFTKAAAAYETDALSGAVMQGVKSDLEKLEALAKISADEIIAETYGEAEKVLLSLPRWEVGTAKEPLNENWAEHIDDLVEYHEVSGYGVYAMHCAFTWHGGEIVPITSTDPIELAELKNYERQRNQVLENTEAFLDGLPANNILLYGDRGTGKSSTVHAVLNAYKYRSLRMIEIAKCDIGDLTQIREKIANSPMKFIIFIDDLSFDAHDDSFGELKAALEGSLSGRQSNTLIYATSNRRHLIKENHSDRENDIHRSDTMQEELSLSDRFGLTITFMNPDKEEFLDITEQIARDRGIDFDTDKLLREAENWARRRGGRSPRCAKQFVDYVEASIKQGKEW
ncbi:MAG: ATP-binding protein [Eubacterium sp.]|nr:ATP-binding protein [Eubacterium sp.]